MSTLSSSVRGPAAPSVAWERYADPHRWPDWAPQINRVETAGDRIVPGLRGRVIGPLGVTVCFEIGDVDEDARMWDWSVELGPIRLTLRHEVVADDAGTRTRLWVTGPLPVAAPYLPIATLALRRLVAE